MGGYRILVWVSFPVALLLTLGWTWLGWSSEVLATERKGIVSAFMLWSSFSCFTMAKLVRDRRQPSKQDEMRRQVPYQVMVLASFFMSTLGGLVAYGAMPL